MCAIFHITTLSVTCANKRQPTCSATTCSTTRGGEPSGSAQYQDAQSPRLTRKGIDVFRGPTLAKQIVNQNCFWPLNQTFADKLLRASKRLLRYVALYSMAGVAMENRLFRIVPCARDTPFIDACAAFLTPKMEFSQVMPSGCNLRRVAIQPRNQLAVPERPSASAFNNNNNNNCLFI